MIKSMRMRWAGHIAQMGSKRNLRKILVGKPDEKRSLGRPKLRWVDNIKMNHREIGWGGIDSSDLAEDRNQCRALVNTVVNLLVA
jgi:hypothetical protein